MIAVALVHHGLDELDEMAVVFAGGKVKLRYRGRLHDVEAPDIWLPLDDAAAARLDDALRDAWERLEAMLD